MFKDFRKVDAVTLELVRNEFSNFHTLLTFLIRRGYVVVWKVLNPKPRMLSSRHRAWLPCSLHPPSATEDEVNGLAALALEVLEHPPSSHYTVRVELHRLGNWKCILFCRVSRNNGNFIKGIVGPYASQLGVLFGRHSKLSKGCV